jgi:hypothetical protein
MRNKLLLTGVLSLFFLPAARGGAIPNAEAAPSKPDWCGSYAAKDDQKAKWVDGYIKSEGWSDRVRNYVALGACDKADDAARQAQVDGWRSQYMAHFGTTARDFSEMAALYMNKDEVEKQRKAFCGTLRTGRGQPESVAKVDQDIGAVLHCGVGSVPDADAALVWWVDRPTSSEITRALYVNGVLERTLGSSTRRRDGELYYGLLDSVDIKGLDRARLDAELNQARFTPFVRTTLRETHGRAKVLSKVYAEFLQSEGAKSADVKKIFADAPEAGAREWNALYQSHKEQFEAAFDLEEKFDVNPAAQKGCSVKLRGYLTAYLAEKKVTTAELAHAISTDPLGYQLMTNLAKCDAVEGNAMAAGFERSEVFGVGNGARLLRGPRIAAYYAAMDAYADAQSKQRPVPFGTPPSLGPSPRTRVDAIVAASDGKPASGGIRYGVVGKLTPSDASVLVTFAKNAQKVYDVQCVEDRSRIAGISSDGKFEYSTYCKPLPTFKMVDRTEQPINVPKALAGSLTVGRTLEFVSDDATKQGFPARVFADKEKKVLVSYVGVPITANASVASAAPTSEAAPAGKSKAKSTKKKK